MHTKFFFGSRSANEIPLRSKAANSLGLAHYRHNRIENIYANKRNEERKQCSKYENVIKQNGRLFFTASPASLTSPRFVVNWHKGIDIRIPSVAYFNAECINNFRFSYFIFSSSSCKRRIACCDAEPHNFFFEGGKCNESIKFIYIFRSTFDCLESLMPDPVERQHSFALQPNCCEKNGFVKLFGGNMK